MSTKDFAESLVEAYSLARDEFQAAPSGSDEESEALDRMRQAKADLIQALHVPSPHSEDFMTPRDQFAMAAMQGELASQNEKAFWRKTDELASRCYLIADSMMKASEVKHD